MRDEDFEDDDLLMSHLAGLAARVDPVPASVTTAARASFSWAGVDSELAELVYDSVVESRELVGCRGGTSRHLAFEGPAVSVECEVGGGRLVGQVVPPQATRIEVRRAEESFVVESDELGRFLTEPVGPGPLSLRFRVGDATAGGHTSTEWVAI